MKLRVPAIIRKGEDVLTFNKEAAQTFNLDGPCKCYHAIHKQDSRPLNCYCVEVDGPRVISIFEPSVDASFARVMLPLESGHGAEFLDVFVPIDTPLAVKYSTNTSGPIVIDDLGPCLDKCISPDNLTAKEAQVLDWIKSGKTTNTISEIMGISENTVNFHMKNLFNKIGAENRTHAAAIAYKSELEQVRLQLREMHHRIKNNFSVLNSLLYIKRSKSKSQEAASALEWASIQIGSIAALHGLLQESSSTNRVKANDYFKHALGKLAAVSSCKDRGIEIAHDIDSMELSMDMAVPCMQIVNELVLNSVEHAFKDSGQGCISVSLKRDGRQMALAIKDNGCGIPMQKAEEGNTMGLRIVRQLVQQLNGTMEVTNSSGTAFHISFAVDKNATNQ